MPFSPQEHEHYLRHLLLSEVGEMGQKKLQQASVLCIGAGGLGSPALLYLAAAGVGTIGIIENDRVEKSNLQRQILYTQQDIGEKKNISAQKKLSSLNPYIQIVSNEVYFCRENARELIAPYDIILDGSDNFPTRFLCNDVCVLEKKINVHAAVHQFQGQLSVFAPHLGTPCYRCLFPEIPPPESVPNCAEAGILGVLPGTLGSLQATEVIKIILGLGKPLYGKLLSYNALENRFYKTTLQRDPKCPICSQEITSLPNDYNYEQKTTCSEMNNDSTQEIPQIDVHELHSVLKKTDVQHTLIDVREVNEFETSCIESAQNIPLSTLYEMEQDKLQALVPVESSILLLCRSGIRSQKAAGIFTQHGYKKTTNIQGGMLAWIQEIDPSLPPC